MGSSTCGFELREARKRIDYIIIMGLQLASRGQCGLVTYDDGLDGHRQSIELNRNSAVLSSCTSFELLRCPAEPIDNGVVIRIPWGGRCWYNKVGTL